LEKKFSTKPLWALIDVGQRIGSWDGSEGGAGFQQIVKGPDQFKQDIDAQEHGHAISQWH
jgi:hypothetical protein